MKSLRWFWMSKCVTWSPVWRILYNVTVTCKRPIYVERKGRDRAQSFALIFTLQLNILTGTFLLFSCSNTFKNYCGLCTVKAKNANKIILYNKEVNFYKLRLYATIIGHIRGVARGGLQGFRNPPPPPLASRNPPLLFLTVILSQQECNGLSISEILRFVLCLQ